MPRLSVAIITFNEERNIKRCIDSVKPVADEIIVVDSGSNDHTQKICEAEGVRFIYKEWVDYSTARNYAAQCASNDWILALDADEALSSELQASVLKLKSSSAPVYASFKRLTNYCGKWIRHCGWYPDIKIRFYDRDKSKFGGIIHEQLSNVPHNVSLLRGDLLHYSYYSVNEHRKQADRFTTLTALDAFSKGKRSNYFKIIINPVVKFIKGYIFQLGFLDGYYGFVVCCISAYATYLKYTKLMRLNKTK